MREIHHGPNQTHPRAHPLWAHSPCLQLSAVWDAPLPQLTWWRGDLRGDFGLFLTGHAGRCSVSHGAAKASRAAARHGTARQDLPLGPGRCEC